MKERWRARNKRMKEYRRTMSSIRWKPGLLQVIKAPERLGFWSVRRGIKEKKEENSTWSGGRETYRSNGQVESHVSVTVQVCDDYDWCYRPDQPRPKRDLIRSGHTHMQHWKILDYCLTVIKITFWLITISWIKFWTYQGPNQVYNIVFMSLYFYSFTLWSVHFFFLINFLIYNDNYISLS